MTRFAFLLITILSISACVAGDFTPERNRLHSMGNEGVCQRRPDLCIDNIPW